MMVFDMTAQLAPIFTGMVALLAISSSAIVANAITPSVVSFFSAFTRRNKPTVKRSGAIAHASA